MTIAYWCVLAAILLPFVFAISAKYLGRFQPKDNHTPRAFLDKLTGPALRAHWAQQNSFESLPGFIAAVLIAQQIATLRAGAGQTLIDALALCYIALRLGYGLAYIADKALLRSALWFGALACIIGLFVVSA